MKNLFKSLLLFVAGAAFAVACGPDQPINVPAGTVISVDLTQEQLANLPARNVPAITFNVTSDGEWLATTPSWIAIDPSHATGSTSVTITVADNVDAEGNLQGPRSGKVTLSLVDAEVSVEVTILQLGDESLDTRRTYVKVTEVTSGKAYLLVVKKTDDSYVIPILFGPTGTYGYLKPKTVTLEEDGSIQMEDASNGLIFTDGGRDAAYKIQQPDGRYIWHQSGFNTWSCGDDPTEGYLWKIDHVFEDGTVRICDVDSGGILQYGNGGYDSFAAYASTDATSILPWLYEDTKAAEIDDSKCYFPSTSVKVAADSTKATFEVSANIPWEITKTEGDWITDFTPKTGSADATVTVTFAANTADGAEARTAKFHLASTDGKKTSDLTLTQASPAVLSFADIIPTLTAEATSTGAKNALIVAAANKRFILNDGTAYMFAYYSGTDCAVGDKVDISGDAMLYDGCPEWNKPVMSVVSSNNEVKHPEPVAIDEAALAAYEKAPEIKYIEVEVFYDGKNKLVGEHVIYTHAAADVTFEKDKTYKITGYAIGYSSSYKNTSVVVTACEEVAVEYDQFELSEAEADAEPAAGSKTFKVVAADNVSWTVALPADATAKLAIAGVEDGSLSAAGTKDVTITYPENTSDSPVQYVVTVAAAEGANVAHKTLTYTLTQASPKVSTFAEIIAGEAGDYSSKGALVVAVGSTNTVVYDKTAYMFIFDKNKVSKVGDVVDLSGAVTTYNGCPEWNNPTIKVVSNNNEVAHPEAVVLNEAAFDAYVESPVIEYAVVEGVRDGYNIKIADGKLVNVYANNATMTDGKTYKVYGYTIGYYAKNKVINFVLTSFEEVTPEYLQFELSTTADEVEAAAGAKTFQVIADASVEWSLAIDPTATVTIEGLQPNEFASSGTKNVTINYAANESAAPVNYVVTVMTRANVEHTTLTYTLTQKGKEGVEALKFEWRTEADTLVTVPFNTPGAAHWYVDADPAVEYELQVLGGNGTVYTESGDGITIEKAAGHVAINYAENTTPYQKVWTIVASTKNENVAVQTLTAKLVQGAYEYSNVAELNAAIIASGSAKVDRIINIPEATPLVVTKKNGKNLFLQCYGSDFMGGLLLYDTAVNAALAEGQGFWGKVVATTTSYNGLPEVTKVTFNETDVHTPWPSEDKRYPCKTANIGEINENYAMYVNAKVKINNVEVTKAFSKSQKSGEIKDSKGTLALYVYATDLTIDIPVGTKAEYVVGWPTVYSNNKQLGLYAASQCKVTSIPGIITMPETLDIVKGSEPVALGATTNSPSPITYTVNPAEGVLTVAEDGTITLAENVEVGATATITASVVAAAPYLAAEATCVVTVKDGSEPQPTVTWVRSSLGSLGKDDVFVFVCTTKDSKTFALSNDKGTGNAPTAVAVTVADGKLSGEIAANIQWTIGGDESGYIFYPNGSTETWLYCTNSNNGVRVGTNENDKFVLDRETSYLKHLGTSRYVGVYNNADWRCYTNTTGNTANQTFDVYKKVVE